LNLNNKTKKQINKGIKQASKPIKISSQIFVVKILHYFLFFFISLIEFCLFSVKKKAVQPKD
jgi:hypothetical protein